MRHSENPEVVYLERGGDSSAKWLFWGVLLGAGLALLYAPRSGEETRRSLQRKLWKLRAMAEERLDEVAKQFGGRKAPLEEFDDAVDDDDPLEITPEPPRSTASARQELERRLSDARRRRAAGDLDLEEPQA